MFSWATRCIQLITLKSYKHETCCCFLYCICLNSYVWQSWLKDVYIYSFVCGLFSIWVTPKNYNVWLLLPCLNQLSYTMWNLRNTATHFKINGKYICVDFMMNKVDTLKNFEFSDFQFQFVFSVKLLLLLPVFVAVWPFLITEVVHLCWLPHLWLIAPVYIVSLFPFWLCLSSVSPPWFFILVSSLVSMCFLVCCFI